MDSKLAETNAASESDMVIGVLALQGAFREHIAHFNKVPGVTALEVRKKEDLDGLDGLVIPGGLSTAETTLIQCGSLSSDSNL